MTTIAMIAGMLPLAIAAEAGSAVRQSLGIVVIGGLTSSLILTLVLVPIMYVWLAPKQLPKAHQIDEPAPPVPTHRESVEAGRGRL